MTTRDHEEIRVGGDLDEQRLREIMSRGWLFRNLSVSPDEAFEYKAPPWPGSDGKTPPWSDFGGSQHQDGETPQIVEIEGNDDRMESIEIHVGCGEMCPVFAEIPYDGDCGCAPRSNAVAIVHAGRDLIDLVREVRRLRFDLAKAEDETRLAQKAALASDGRIQEIAKQRDEAIRERDADRRAAGQAAARLVDMKNQNHSLECLNISYKALYLNGKTILESAKLELARHLGIAPGPMLDDETRKKRIGELPTDDSAYEAAFAESCANMQPLPPRPTQVAPMTISKEALEATRASLAERRGAMRPNIAADESLIPCSCPEVERGTHPSMHRRSCAIYRAWDQVLMSWVSCFRDIADAIPNLGETPRIALLREVLHHAADEEITREAIRRNLHPGQRALIVPDTIPPERLDQFVEDFHAAMQTLPQSDVIMFVSGTEGYSDAIRRVDTVATVIRDDHHPQVAHHDVYTAPELRCGRHGISEPLSITTRLETRYGQWERRASLAELLVLSTAEAIHLSVHSEGLREALARTAATAVVWIEALDADQGPPSEPAPETPPDLDVA